MKKTYMNSRLAVAVATLGLMGVASGALGADTVTADASADVVATLSVTQSTALAFGTFSPGAGGGTLTVANDDSRSVTGDVDLVGTDGAAGDFTVGGEASTTYTIAVPTSVTLDNQTGTGGETMSFVPSAPASSALDTNGAGNFSVTGELTVGAGQVAGNYTGTYDVTVAYQ